MISNVEELESKALDHEGLVNISTKLLFDKEAGVGSIGRIYTFHRGGYTDTHMHPWFHVFYVLDGEGIISIDGIEHFVKKGACCVIPARMVHKIRNIGDNDFMLMSIAGDETEYRFKRG